MRRIVMIGALVMVLVALFASAALARNFQCTTRPCEGTDNPDTIIERGGDGVGDLIYGKGGGDLIRAEVFGDDRDLLYGGPGPDELNADDGDPFDELHGGRGNDVCRGDAGDEFFGCEVRYVDGVLQ
jgi:Ca2+-binding RTX toxin-like protein